jgi:two-component system cell cycle sensor histidine kinase/response regulator CckA
LESDFTLLSVLGDQGQLRQIFLNILLNAVETTTPLGSIRITLQHHGGQAEVFVKDTGIGIEKVEVECFFDPFYTSKPKGHGLGLAAVERIISAHHGQVRVSRQQGVVTEITVSLPLDTMPGRSEPLPEFRKMGSIFVAEDESIVRSIMVQRFEVMGINVLETKNGNERVKLFTLHQAVIVFVSLDVNMSGLTRWQCLEHIRGVSTDLPVLIVSGYNPQAEKSPAQDCHTCYLSKPCRQQQLQAATSGLINPALNVDCP